MKYPGVVPARNTMTGRSWAGLGYGSDVMMWSSSGMRCVTLLGSMLACNSSLSRTEENVDKHSY